MRRYTLALFALLFLATTTAQAGLFHRKARKHREVVTACQGRSCAPREASTAPVVVTETRIHVRTVQPAPVRVAPPAACYGGNCPRR